MKITHGITVFALALACTWTTHALATTIASAGFDNEAAGDFYDENDTLSGTLASGATLDLTNTDGKDDGAAGGTVDSTVSSSLAGDWGFDLTFKNTRNDLGLSDGDYIGVTSVINTATSGPANAPIVYTSGTQGYEFSDTDGRFILTFDPINITGYTDVMLAFDLFVRESNFEASEDYLLVTAGDGTNTLTLVNDGGAALTTRGLATASDIAAGGGDGDDGFIAQSFSLAGLSGNVTVKIEVETNSSNEAVFIDSLAITGVPEPGSVMLLAASTVAPAAAPPHVMMLVR